MPRVDLNCDLGEGAAFDAELMPLITSANIACGAHAGDEATMRTTIALALRHGVAIGAHPGFADRENFGRVELPVTPAEAAVLVADQIGKLRDVAHQAGAVVRHVKLHGALYNMVSRDRKLAEAVMNSIWAVQKNLAVYVLAGSEGERVAREIGGMAVVSEVFADRSYQPDGSLTPRSRPEALLASESAAVEQVLGMVREGCVRAIDGRDVKIRAETICLHGDGANAVDLARNVAAALRAAGIQLKRPGA